MTGARWPRILSEQLVPVPEPLTVALEPGREAPPRGVVQTAARALLDGTTLGRVAPWPPWLAPHQLPAAERLTSMVARYGGALLADEVGLGKSYVALAIALERKEPFALVVPAVLAPQWRALLERFGVHNVPILSHESLSTPGHRPLPALAVPYGLFVIDEAHRFRNPETQRYRALARLVVGARVLLLTATPVHNRIADLFHLLRLFLRDHAFAALGVPSLHRASADGEVTGVAARVVVARSRARIRAGYRGGPIAMTFPRLASTETVRSAPAPDEVLEPLIAGIGRLCSGGAAAPLLRLMLLRRLSSSLPAFRASLLRHDAYLDMAARAAAEGRGLSPREFQACFPRAAESDVQLVLFPLLVDAPAGREFDHDRTTVAELRSVLGRLPACDPKVDALRSVLGKSGKTIVFTDAQHTARYLLHQMKNQRAAAVYGTAGRFAAGVGSRTEVLRAFAPRAAGVTAIPAAVRTDVLIATDLLSEGLNLQDAECVVHYDLPWSPARLAQRVGRIDRLGSPHQSISTVTFLPPAPLARALAIEERLAAKVGAQVVAGTHGQLDWCDRLASLISSAPGAPIGACAAVTADRPATVLVVRIGDCVEAIVVEDQVARAGAAAATRMLVDSWTARSVPLDQEALRRAIHAAVPLIRARLAALQDARWRASDRDRFARRLIPWVLSAGRRAARRGNAEQLRALDGLVSRLALGMTAGEELLLDDLLGDEKALSVADMLAWHQRLPPALATESSANIQLVAAVVMTPS